MNFDEAFIQKNLYIARGVVIENRHIVSAHIDDIRKLNAKVDRLDDLCRDNQREIIALQEARITLKQCIVFYRRAQGIYQTWNERLMLFYQFKIDYARAGQKFSGDTV